MGGWVGHPLVSEWGVLLVYSSTGFADITSIRSIMALSAPSYLIRSCSWSILIWHPWVSSFYEYIANSGAGKVCVLLQRQEENWRQTQKQAILHDSVTWDKMCTRDFKGWCNGRKRLMKEISNKWPTPCFFYLSRQLMAKQQYFSHQFSSSDTKVWLGQLRPDKHQWVM